MTKTTTTHKKDIQVIVQRQMIYDNVICFITLCKTSSCQRVKLPLQFANSETNAPLKTLKKNIPFTHYTCLGSKIPHEKKDKTKSPPSKLTSTTDILL